MTYDRIVIVCMSQLDIKKLDEINNLTLNEFYYRVQAQEFINLKNEYDMIKLAFFIRDVAVQENRGTDKNPKMYYKYNSVNDILDYQENYHRLFEGKDIVYKNASGNNEMTENDHKLAALFAEFNNKS